MPLYLTENIKNIGTFALWQLTESEEELLSLRPLSEQEDNEFSFLKNSKRRKEWLTIRILLQHLTGGNFLLNYLPNGKPLLQEPKLFLSISHSENFVAVFISKNKEVGIDVEKFRKNINLLKNKFLCPEELSQIDVSDEMLLHIYWGAKEAMYKMYSFYHPLFTEHLSVQYVDYQKYTAIGKIEKENLKKTVKILFRRIENNILVCVFEA